MQNDPYKVIIIGAGISGIGASKMLSDRNVPHLILESRDRIGGRICPENIDGCTVQLGASFVHSPERIDNLIARHIKERSLKVFHTHKTPDVHYY